MKKALKFLALLLCAATLLSLLPAAMAADGAFTLVSQREIESLGGTVYCYEHAKTGAQVIYLDDGSESRGFSIGFRTPPTDSKGANHVLEHSLLCGSEKYPTKNIMHYLQGGALAEVINAVTSDDCTYYLVRTPNETEYYNLMDVYLDSIFHPLLLTDENIFRQQGIRLEYADGKAQYNGVVYNELRIKSYDTLENSVTFLSDRLYDALYGDTAPAFSSGGTLDALKELTYEDVLRVYNTYYVPSNCMVYLSGQQDIDKTLALLDSFFQSFDRQDVEIRFEDTKQLPEKPVLEYNVTEDTKTADIGFMSSGVPMTVGVRELYARDIIFSILFGKMGTLHQNRYTVGGNSGGVANLAMLCSEVPMEQVDTLIAAYQDALKELGENGFDPAELEQEVGEYFDSKDQYMQGTDLDVFQGILYHNDPFYYMDRAAARADLLANPSYFDEILKKYFTENPYRITIISGNGAAEAEEELDFSAQELEQIRLDTEEFNRWADAPDDPAVIAAIPTLTLDEVRQAPALTAPRHEQEGGIDFYLTEREDDYAGLYLPLPISAQELDTVSLAYFYIGNRLSEAGIDNVYLYLTPMENAAGQLNPQLMLGITGEDKAAALEAAVALLKDESLWNTDSLWRYVQTAPEEILQYGYRDPFYLSYELKQSALSPGSSFYAQTIGSVQQGSPRYYRFLLGLAEADMPELVQNGKALTEKMLRGVPCAEYIGTSGYAEFKAAVLNLFGGNTGVSGEQLVLPEGYPSAVIITPLADMNHFMMAGSYSSQKYSGTLKVLGSVLTQNYILPTLRGKYGAYGAHIAFDERGMTVAAAGLSDVDQFVQVVRGMGDYVRSLDMTQKELDAVIIPLVKEYDEWYYQNAEQGAQLALSGKTPQDITRIREEMLSVTVEDLRACAGFVDELVTQNRVYAVLGQEAADSAKFPFAYRADATTLEITPLSK